MTIQLTCGCTWLDGDQVATCNQHPTLRPQPPAILDVKLMPGRDDTRGAWVEEPAK